MSEYIGIELNEEAKPKATIKRSNEDFIVCESTENGVIPVLNRTQLNGFHGKGKYTLYNLTKNGLTTHDAISEVASHLKVADRDFTYQGMKDRHAITSQLIAIESRHLGARHDFQHQRIFLQDIGNRNKPLRIGGNTGNFFRIRVLTCHKWIDLSKIKKIPNFFGQQRFGKMATEQHVGRLLLMGFCEEAASSIQFPPQIRQYGHILEECAGDHKRAFLHPKMHRSTRFSVQQWQSYLFNRLVSRYIGKEIDLPNSFALWTQGSRKTYESVWDHRGKIDTDFARFASPTVRKTIIAPQCFSYDNSDNQSVTLQFQLPSGSYATVVLGQLFELIER